MKLRFSLKDKEASLDADVEKIIEKHIDQKSNKKTRYQIKQEERRKNEELKHKQQMTYLFMLLGLIGVLLIFGLIATVLNI